MSALRSVLPNARAAAEACALRIRELIDATLAHAPKATLALSGGTSPKPMFESMARSDIDWDRVHLFWVDERCVPPTDPASNYKLANELLIEPARIPEDNVHRIHAEIDPRDAAALYEKQIRMFFGLAEGELPRFDVIHRGIGPDAHTASLFPGQPLIRTGRGIAAAAFAPQFNQWRVTLLPGVLEAAGNTVILATGADKSEALRAVFNSLYDPLMFPAQIAAEQSVWFLDEAAARQL